MNTRLLSISFWSLLSVTSFAQSKADRAVIKELRTDISYLASDELQGRRTGSEGEKKAATYIKARYEKNGIKPFQGKYEHTFKFIYGKEAAKSTQILVGGKIMRLNEDAFVLPFSANKRTYSEVLPDIMEQGNVWLINLYGEEDEHNHPHADLEKVMYERSKEAQKQGAAGVLFYDGIGTKWPPRFNTQSELEALDIPVGFLTHDAYQKYVTTNTAYEGIVQRQKGGLPIELNTRIVKTERTGTNVAAYIDNKVKYTVVIGAHYDHLGMGEDGSSLSGKEPQIHNGADDNASGTAGLLALAERIHKNKLHHYNYLFLHFSAEELGLIGSKNFIKDAAGIDSNHIAYMINMDMIGRLNDSTKALTVGGIGTSPAWASVISTQDKNFKFTFDSSGVGPSDHTSFYHAGIPVLFFFTGSHKDYHKASDDAEKINYEGEAKVLNYIYGIVSKMDKMGTKPPFTPTKQSSAGKVSFKVTLGIMPDYTYQDGGVRVDGVSEGKPAQLAGIKEGDIITRLGEFEVKGMQSYMEALGKFTPGNSTEVTIDRAGKTLILPLQFSK